MKHKYSNKPVTPWGGMKEMKVLIDKIQELGIPESKSNNKINGVNIIEFFWVSIWIGCSKFSHTAVVRMDEVIRSIFGWKLVASGTSVGRYFKKFTIKSNRNFFLGLYQWFFESIKFDNYTLDIDSSVITR